MLQHRPVCADSFNATMAEDAAIRRANLHALLRSRGWSPRDLSDRFHGRYTYWRDLLNDPKKSFGEKVARRLEEEASLPRLWLDQPEPDLEVLRFSLIAAEPTPPMAPPGWPWSGDLWLTIKALDEDQLQQVERLLRAHLGL